MTQGQRDLHEDQLVIDEPATGGDGLAAIERLVDRAISIRAAHQFARGEEFRSEPFADWSDGGIEIGRDDPLDRFAAQFGAGGVNGAELGIFDGLRVRLDDFPFWIHHLRNAVGKLYVSAHAQQKPGMNLTTKIRAVEEDQRQAMQPL